MAIAIASNYWALRFDMPWTMCAANLFPTSSGTGLSGAQGSACAIAADKTSCCSIFSTPGSGAFNGNTVSLSFPGAAPSSEAFNKSSRFLISIGPTASFDIIAISQVIEINREAADGPANKSHGIVALVRRGQGCNCPSYPFDTATEGQLDPNCLNREAAQSKS